MTRNTPDTERAAGSERLESLRKSKPPAYVEVWFGAEKVGSYTPCAKGDGYVWQERAREAGFAGYLDGHTYKSLDAPPTPRRRVRVFLREEPAYCLFRWCRDVPPAVLREGEQFSGDWRAL
jgi:hypothetical protein